MGKVQEFDISFDKNKVVYSPGESISGTVTIKLGQPLQCKGKSPLTPAHLAGRRRRAEQGSEGFIHENTGCVCGPHDVIYNTNNLTPVKTL